MFSNCVTLMEMKLETLDSFLLHPFAQGILLDSIQFERVSTKCYSYKVVSCSKTDASPYLQHLQECGFQVYDPNDPKFYSTHATVAEAKRSHPTQHVPSIEVFLCFTEPFFDSFC